jgi:hypothetical protein
MKWMLLLLSGIALFAFACGSDDNSDSSIAPAATTSSDATPAPSGTSGISDAIVQQLKPLIGDALEIDQNVISDVELDENELKVTVKENELPNGASDIEQACNNVADKVNFTNLKIVVNSDSGKQLAECSMTG